MHSSVLFNLQDNYHEVLLNMLSMNSRLKNRNFSVLQEAVCYLWYKRCFMARDKELDVSINGAVSMLRG